LSKSCGQCADSQLCTSPGTDDGKIVPIRQYCYAVDDSVWEVPAGGKHDHDGSDEELARHEL